MLHYTLNFTYLDICNFISLFSQQESLEALETLPEATLFDESSVSSVWLDVVERSQKFLTSVVLSQVSGGGKSPRDSLYQRLWSCRSFLWFR